MLRLLCGLYDRLWRLDQSARCAGRIIALDGCSLDCVKSYLARHGIEADRHYQLNQYGVEKGFVALTVNQPACLC